MSSQKTRVFSKEINPIYHPFCLTPLYLTKSIFSWVCLCVWARISYFIKTAKELIHEAYNWSYDQLSSLLHSSVTSIHLTTNLWTAKSWHGYLGVTVTWLSSDFKFREALLSCEHLPYPHTGEVISEELFRIICEWCLETIVFTIATDNGINMVKGIWLLNNNYISSVEHQPCAAHILQLSVQEGLKQCKAVHHRIKSLQAFFWLPKQA